MIKTFSTVWKGLKLFINNNCLTSAAAMSFYAFFSLIPLMILITASLGFIFGIHAGLLDRVIEMVRQGLPYLSERFINDLRGLSDKWQSYGWLGLLFLVYSTEMVLGATSEALTAIFGTTERYGFLRRKVLNLFVLLLAIIASLMSLVMTAVSIVFTRHNIEVAGVKLLISLIDSLVFKLVLPFFLMAGMVAVVFKILSGPNMTLRYSFYGSLLFTVLWESAKQLFAWYVSNFGSYNKFYGSLGTLMILLLWIFYSSNIFLFSACIAKSAYDNKDAGRENRRVWRPKR
ncbi:MAG TPA: YihY/virulence factor BrkB family protein [Thermodesulfobacteriota bacterium]|nr:YihY/virulence factor BrkB family protein [Thermodesulfobacteriota bacterium]